MLEVGKKINDFSLKDENEKQVSLSDFLGKKVLIYFYPKDDTPGCTTEAKCFRDRLNDLGALNVQVLGISADDTKSHQKFIKKYDLNFPLLSDSEHKISKMFGVFKEKNIYGKKFMGINRESFLINENGILIKHYSKVNPSEHVNEIINDLKKEIEI